MAHLGLRLSPIGQGEFQQHNESNNNEEEEVWTVPAHLYGRNKIPLGNASTNSNGQMLWARKPNTLANKRNGNNKKTKKTKNNKNKKPKNNLNASRKANNGLSRNFQGNNIMAPSLRLENL